MLSKALRVELRRFCLWDQPQLWIGGYAGWRMPESYGGNPSAFSRTIEKNGDSTGIVSDRRNVLFRRIFPRYL